MAGSTSTPLTTARLRALSAADRGTLFAAEYAQRTPSVHTPWRNGVLVKNPPHILKLYADAKAIRERIACGQQVSA